MIAYIAKFQLNLWSWSTRPFPGWHLSILGRFQDLLGHFRTSFGTGHFRTREIKGVLNDQRGFVCSRRWREVPNDQRGCVCRRRRRFAPPPIASLRRRLLRSVAASMLWKGHKFLNLTSLGLPGDPNNQRGSVGRARHRHAYTLCTV